MDIGKHCYPHSDLFSRENAIPFLDHRGLDNATRFRIRISRQQGFGFLPGLGLIDNQRTGIVDKRSRREQFPGVEQLGQIRRDELVGFPDVAPCRS